MLAVSGLIGAGQFLSAKALVARMLSTPEKVVAADTIVVGKVVAIEDKAVEVEVTPGAPKVSYKVASIKIDDSIKGAKGLTHVRVGFIPTPAAPRVNPGTGGPPIRIRRPGMNLTLEVGQEGCFFLSKFGQSDFMQMPPLCQYIDKRAGDFDKQVALARKTVGVISDPIKALKAKEESDRFQAAAIMLQKYNAIPAGATGQMVRKPIGAEESKLILAAIRDADWSKTDDAMMNPLAVFQRLGLQPKDGFTYPRVQPGQDFNQVMQDAAKKWLKENADKYRVQRWVEQKN
jgi:hypothetical protein